MRPAARTTTAGSEPPLRQGMRLTQPEFHRRYEAYPEDVKFELIGGVVYMASPLSEQHGFQHTELIGAFVQYKTATPGTRQTGDATTILGKKSEPRPDLSLRILSDYGGQARVNDDGYLEGAPELIAEVSLSREDIDLGAKREDYQKAGVLEYLVVCLREQAIHWFDFRAGKEIRPRRGVYRSRVFPGLWIDGPALLAGDSARLIQAVQEGIATPAHARFVQRLARAHDRLSRRAQS
jgi:Uma2 family endonuclease